MRKKILLVGLIGIFLIIPILDPIQEKVEVNSSIIGISSPGDKWDRILITSNGDFSTYASSGDGSSGDPWILENYIIDCNGTGIGITIQDTTDYAIIRDCKVNESGSTPNAGIVLNNADNIKIQDTNVTNNTNIAIAIVLSDNTNISGVNLYGNAIDVYSDNSNDIYFDNCTFHDSNNFYYNAKNYGASNSTNLLVENSIIENHSSGALIYYFEGIIIKDSNLTNTEILEFTETRDVLVENCIFDDIPNSQCIRFRTSINCTAFNNSFSNPTQDTTCIDLSWGSVMEYDINITSNNFTGFYTTINLDYVDNVIIENNTINGETRGIQLIAGNAGLDNIIINGNNLSSSRNHGVYLIGDIAPRGENITIYNNNFTSTSYYQDSNYASIYLHNFDNGNVSSNIIYHSNESSIDIGDLSNFTFDSNDIRNCTDLDMITINNDCDNLTFSNNYLYSPKLTGYGACDAGIYNEGSDNLIIINNTFDSFNDTINGYGYLGLSSENLTFTGNNFTNCRYGMSLAGTNVEVTENYFLNNVDGNVYDDLPGGTVINNNYFGDYFDLFPNAIYDSSSMVLEYEYNLTSTKNDSNPLYDPSIYPRNEEVSISLSKSSNPDESFFSDSVNIYIDDLETLEDSQPGSVCYHLEIIDFFNEVIHDQVYNMNTTQDIDLELDFRDLSFKNNLDVPVKVFIRKNSITLDYQLNAKELNPSGLVDDDNLTLIFYNDEYTYWIEDLNGNEIIGNTVVILSSDHNVVITITDTGGDDQDDQDDDDEITIFIFEFDPILLIAIISLPILLLLLIKVNQPRKRGNQRRSMQRSRRR